MKIFRHNHITEISNVYVNRTKCLKKHDPKLPSREWNIIIWINLYRRLVMITLCIFSPQQNVQTFYISVRKYTCTSFLILEIRRIFLLLRRKGYIRKQFRKQTLPFQYLLKVCSLRITDNIIKPKFCYS